MTDVPRLYDWLERVSIRDPKVRERIVAILQHSEPEVFLKMVRWADERLHGRPAQSIEHGGTATIILRAIRE